jgi:parvulin-like peptidyl-prolyl isomerase
MAKRSVWVVAGIGLALLVAAGAAVWWARRAPAVAATVNGEPIYTAEVDRYVREIGRRLGVDFSRGEAARQRPQVARSVLDQLIERALILQEARRTGRLATDAEVDRRVGELAARFRTQEEFEQALAREGISRTELRERLRFELTVQRMLDALPAPQVREQEARAYFQAHRELFDEPERVRVRHILLRTEAEARVALARLRAGEPFDRLARELSQDPASRERGGDLGVVAPGQTVPEFEQVAFSLQPGQLSDPVRTSFGYHVVQVTQRLPARRATWETAREEVLRLFRETKRREAFERWLQQARSRARIAVHL